jgi:type IV pilus assembly protein PilC
VSPPPHIPTYRWHGTDARGQPQQGTLQASDIELARALLRREGIRVQQLERQWWSRQKPLSGKTITSMTRQWAALIRAGVSLVPALQMLQRSATQPTLARLLEEVRQDVESGLALSQALDRHPQAFGPLYVSMVHAGESAGILDTMMERLAQTLEKNEKLRSRVRAALTYPVVVTVLALAVLVLMLMYVVPVFEEVFQSFGAELPWSTRAVLTLSQAVSHGAPWAALLALPMLALLRRQWQQPATGGWWGCGGWAIWFAPRCWPVGHTHCLPCSKPAFHSRKPCLWPGGPQAILSMSASTSTCSGAWPKVAA